MWRGTAAGLGAAFGAPGVVAGAVGSGILAAVQEKDPGQKLRSGLITAAVQAVHGSVGAVFGVPGVAFTAGMGFLDGLRIEDRSRANRSLELSSPTENGARKSPVHVITVEDAGESAYASDYLQQMEVVKAEAGEALHVDLRLEREPAPFIKLLAGGMWSTLVVAGGMMAGTGWLGAGLTVGALRLLRGQTTGRLASGAAGLTLPLWSGRRHYEVVADQTRGFDSTVTWEAPREERPAGMGPMVRPPARGSEEVQEFLKTSMAKYPSSLKVVHLAGHGNGYAQSSGFGYEEFGRVIQAVDGAADLLVLDTCLGGNLEALARVAEAAPFVLVSEENIEMGVIPETLRKTLAQLGDEPTDARALGTALIAQASTVSGAVPETLALVDTSKLADLNDSVGELGSLLADEVRQGRRDRLKPVLERASRFPRSSWLERKMVALGDLKLLVEDLQMTRGDDAIGRAAGEVVSALDEAVVARQTSGPYRGTGGISIQLPGASRTSLYPSYPYEKTDAPQGWKEFLTVWEA